MRWVRNVDIVGTTEIADRCSVYPSAVSNWVRRSPDFPTPLARLAMGNVWSWFEVSAWLTRTGRANLVVRHDP